VENSAAGSSSAQRGKEVWILALYPISRTAKPFKVVKFASDVTDQKLKAATSRARSEAIGKSQAVIEFNMEAFVLNAKTISSRRLATRCPKSGQASQHVRVGLASARALPIARFWANLKPGEFQSRRSNKRDRQGRQGIWSSLYTIHPGSQRQRVQGGQICHGHHGQVMHACG